MDSQTVRMVDIQTDFIPDRRSKNSFQCQMAKICAHVAIFGS